MGRFSPHQDIISRPTEVLAKLPNLRRDRGRVGTRIAAAAAAGRLCRGPLTAAAALDRRCRASNSSQSLIESGYCRVPQVSEHGEFAVRGSLIDVFPMGSGRPHSNRLLRRRYRVAALFFRGNAADPVSLLDRLSTFCRRAKSRWMPRLSRSFRDRLSRALRGAARQVAGLSRSIRRHRPRRHRVLPAAVFPETTATLLDYLPDDSIVVDASKRPADLLSKLEAEIAERYQLLRMDPERPILRPEETFASAADMCWTAGAIPQIFAIPRKHWQKRRACATLTTRLPPA